MSTVDVVMPVGPGSQPFFREAILSLLSSKGIDFRVIVVLDGRSELPWLVQGERLEIIVNSGQRGIAGAMNAGIEFADSPLIAVMHSDDIVHPQRLMWQSDALSRDVALGVVGTERFDPVIDPIPAELKEAPPLCVINPRRLVFANPIVDPSSMFRRELWQQVGGYREGMKSIQDYEFWLRLAQFSSMGIMRYPLLGYRQHDGQYSRKRPPNREWRAVRRARRRLARSNGDPAILGNLAAACHFLLRSHMSVTHQLGSRLTR